MKRFSIQLRVTLWFTVLMVAPVALNISKKLGISPVPSVISIAISSNLQGAATLVGDTTSILLGGYAGLDFLDFFVFRGKPGIFWAVELGAVFSALMLGEDLFTLRNLAALALVSGGIAIANYVREGKDGAKQA